MSFFFLGVFSGVFNPTFLFTTELNDIDDYNLVTYDTLHLLHLFSDSKSKNTQDRGDPNDPSVRLKRDCVGLMAAFKLKDTSQNVVIVANTHIYW